MPRISSLLATTTLFLASPSFAITPYTIADLVLPGGWHSHAASINANGQVAGTSNNSDGNYNHAFLFSNGSFTDLGTLGPLPFIDSNAYAINSSVQITGYSMLPDGASYAFLYTNGSMQNLGSLGGRSASHGINDAGQITGYSDLTFNTNSPSRAFLYDNGTMNDLGTLGGSFSTGYAINNNGIVVGQSYLPGNDIYHAFLYADGTMNDLGTLGGPSSSAKGINVKNQITGFAEYAAAARHAFLYDNGIMTNLGSLDGESIGNAINDNGQIVGDFYKPAILDYHAFLYSNGQMTDLNSLLPPNSKWTFESASGINNNGQIVGTGKNPLGQTHAFLLTPAQPGDANLDARVTIDDLDILAANWQRTTTDWFHADFNNDGKTDILDLNLLATQWQSGVGSLYSGLSTKDSGLVPTPEPTSLSLLTLAAGRLFLRRRSNRIIT